MIQGRGEFVCLALEAAGAPNIDVAPGREDTAQGMRAMLGCLQDDIQPHPPFAPPFVKDGGVLAGQTVAIIHFLAPQLKLTARGEPARIWTQ